MRRILVFLILAVVTAAAPRAARAQDYKLIVNAANPVAELKATQVAQLFLKQTSTFANGVEAAPVYQPKASAVRVAFDRRVLGKSVTAVETYWQQQIFSGKDVPPPTRTTDDDVIAYVKANPGGIGYISADAAAAGVKVIAVR